MNEHDVIAGAVATEEVAAMFEHLAGWLSPDRMKNGLTIDTGPKHRTEDSHGTVHRGLSRYLRSAGWGRCCRIQASVPVMAFHSVMALSR